MQAKHYRHNRDIELKKRYKNIHTEFFAVDLYTFCGWLRHYILGNSFFWRGGGG